MEEAPAPPILLGDRLHGFDTKVGIFHLSNKDSELQTVIAGRKQDTNSF